MTIRIQALNSDGSVFAEVTAQMPVAARNRIIDAYRNEMTMFAPDPNNPPEQIGRKRAFKLMSRDVISDMRKKAQAQAAAAASRAAVEALTPDQEPTIAESADDD